MWILENSDGEIVSQIENAHGIVINDISHSASIFYLWSDVELNNVGIYRVDDSFYDASKFIQTGVSYKKTGSVYKKEYELTQINT